MGTMVDIDDAKIRLPELIERARMGEEIMIAVAGEPVARILPERLRKPRRPGSAKGSIVIHDDFDAPLPDDLLDLFEGKNDPFLGD